MFDASLMQVSCKFHASFMQVSCKAHASFMQVSCKFHASFIEHAHAYVRIHSPISWKKVHILSLRRDQSADILCMVSSLLLLVTAVLLDHGRVEASSQRLFFICCLGSFQAAPLRYALLVSMFGLLVVFHCSFPFWFTYFYDPFSVSLFLFYLLFGILISS